MMLQKLLLILMFAVATAEVSAAAAFTSQHFIVNDHRSSSPSMMHRADPSSSSAVHPRQASLSNNMVLSDGESSSSPQTILELRGEASSERNAMVTVSKSSGFAWTPIGGQKVTESASSNLAANTDSMGFSSIPVGLRAPEISK